MSIRLRELPAMHSNMHLYPINELEHRVSHKRTAFGYRDATCARANSKKPFYPTNLSTRRRIEDATKDVLRMRAS